MEFGDSAEVASLEFKKPNLQTTMLSVSLSLYMHGSDVHRCFLNVFAETDGPSLTVPQDSRSDECDHPLSAPRTRENRVLWGAKDDNVLETQSLSLSRYMIYDI